MPFHRLSIITSDLKNYTMCFIISFIFYHGNYKMIEGDMIMHKDDRYDFTSIGQAIKAARLEKGWTREQLAQKVDLAPLYIMSLENKGQHPSFQVFVELMTLFNISVDQFLFPNTKHEKSTRRRQLDAELDELTDQDYIVVTATAKGLKDARDE